LSLCGTKADDDVLGCLENLKHLSHLSLANTNILRAGIEPFYGHPNLYMLTLPLEIYSASLERKLKKTCKEFGLLCPGT
jgi:hypothetical protein